MREEHSIISCDGFINLIKKARLSGLSKVIFSKAKLIKDFPKPENYPPNEHQINTIPHIIERVYKCANYTIYAQIKKSHTSLLHFMHLIASKL